MTEKAILNIASPDLSYTMEACPAAGGCVTSFRKQMTAGQQVDLLRAWRPDRELGPLNAASFPMVPYTNRIKDSLLHIGDEEIYVGPAHGIEPNALHGDGWKLSWTVEEISASRLVLFLTQEASDLSPYRYDARQIFTLDNNGLDMDMEITNRSGRNLPFAFGQHTYFDRRDDTLLKANLRGVWTGGANMIPDRLGSLPEKWNFTQGRVLCEKEMGRAEEGFKHTDFIDNCFTGWDGKAEISYPDKDIAVIMTADPDLFGKVVMYMPGPGGDYFAFEAVPNIIDAFNKKNSGISDTGTIMLADNETLRGRVRLEAKALSYGV